MNPLSDYENWNKGITTFRPQPTDLANLGQALLQRRATQEQKQMSGNKPIVVCNGQAQEAKDLTEAQALAERLAHQHQADAYILKPVKKVAPKRDVVTTDLE